MLWIQRNVNSIIFLFSSLVRSLPPKSKSCVKSLFERLIYHASEEISPMHQERKVEQQKVLRILDTIVLGHIGFTVAKIVIKLMTV